jgi:MFS family permease
LLPEDSYQRVLANRSFLAPWFGQGLASLGQAILYVALALYVYDLTGSAQGVSLAVALELLAWVVVGPVLSGWLIGVFGNEAAFFCDQTLWAEVTPAEARGRIFSLAEATVSLVAVVTALLSGWLIYTLSPVPALTGIGPAMALGALVLSLSNRSYRVIAGG